MSRFEPNHRRICILGEQSLNPDFSHRKRFMTQMLGFVRLLSTKGNTGRIFEVLKSLTNSMIKSETPSGVRNPG
jgi:hypothetical protein